MDLYGYEFPTNDPIFTHEALTYHEQTFIRGKPKQYLLGAIHIFKRLTNAKVILEVGSIRKLMKHSIEEFMPSCCNDGHSTYFWKHFTDASIYTVDINPECKAIIEGDARLTGVSATTADALSYLSTFPQSVDLLFLDAWDVVPGSSYAESHVAAYLAIKHTLSPNCLVLIDDTDICKEGKGKLLIPKLLEDGFTRICSGRQSLFIRENPTVIPLQVGDTIFTGIYKHKVWGSDGEKEFYSGGGSHTSYVVEPYVTAILSTKILKNLDCVDLGCGDFNVGSQIRPHFKRYIACDVVAPLIEHNIKAFEDLHVEFLLLNGTTDPLPKGDVICIRQVLQHLSNNDISRILAKLGSFQYAIITEHLPFGTCFVANMDKQSGHGTRLPFNSGVVLHEPPFSISYASKVILSEVNDSTGIITTVMYTF
jgi:hypothetical protein